MTAHRKENAEKRAPRDFRSVLERVGMGAEREYFTENLAMLLTSGMDIMTALRAIRAEVRSRALLRVIDELASDIDAGMPLSRALFKARFLPDYVISLARIGEETGRLSQNLKVIAEEQQKSRVFKSKVRSAMIYPVLVFTVTVAVGIGVAWFILPRLAVVFAELRLDLPAVTRALLALGAFLGAYGIVAVPVFLALFIGAVYIVFFFPSTKFIGQAVLFRFPQVKKLIQDIELARMGFMMGTLLEAGVPVTTALASLRDATAFYAYRLFYERLRNDVEEGSSFAQSFRGALKSRALIPIPIQELIATAERSGKLAATFAKIGNLFEERTDITTKNLTIVLEPFLLIVVWCGVVIVGLAVILPIYSLIGEFQLN